MRGIGQQAERRLAGLQSQYPRSMVVVEGGNVRLGPRLAVWTADAWGGRIFGRDDDGASEAAALEAIDSGKESEASSSEFAAGAIMLTICISSGK